MTLPTALLIPNSYLVWGEASYSYTPTIGYAITGTVPLKDTLYMKPRLSDAIARTVS